MTYRYFSSLLARKNRVVASIHFQYNHRHCRFFLNVSKYSFLLGSLKKEKCVLPEIKLIISPFFIDNQVQSPKIPNSPVSY